MESECSFWNRRDFLKVGGTSAAALGMAGAEAATAQAAQKPAGQTAMPADTPYPKLSIITPELISRICQRPSTETTSTDAKRMPMARAARTASATQTD